MYTCPMRRPTYEEQVLEMLGDAREVDRDLRAFRKDALLLSSRRKQLVKRFPDQWIGIHDGEIIASGPSVEAVVRQFDAAGVPRGRGIVRYISRKPRKMFL